MGARYNPQQDPGALLLIMVGSDGNGSDPGQPRRNSNTNSRYQCLKLAKTHLQQQGQAP